MLIKLNEFPTKAIFETAPEFSSTFFFKKLFEFKTKGDFESWKYSVHRIQGNRYSVASSQTLYKNIWIF